MKIELMLLSGKIIMQLITPRNIMTVHLSLWLSFVFVALLLFEFSCELDSNEMAFAKLRKEVIARKLNKKLKAFSEQKIK